MKLLLADLVERADELSINSKNMGLICYCGTCPDGLKAFVGDSKVYSESLNTGVFMYGSMPWDSRIRNESSMLLVKTGKGLDDYTKKSIDQFYLTALDRGMDIKLINYENGFKYFDVTETGRSSWEYGANPAFAGDCDVMKEILAWIGTKMLSEAR